MKQLFLILALALGTTQIMAQKKAPVDSVAPLTDSTRLLSIGDVVEFDQLLQQKFTVRELRTYQELFRWWQERIALRVKEYEAKQKGGK